MHRSYEADPHAPVARRGEAKPPRARNHRRPGVLPRRRARSYRSRAAATKSAALAKAKPQAQMANFSLNRRTCTRRGRAHSLIPVVAGQCVEKGDDGRDLLIGEHPIELSKAHRLDRLRQVSSAAV